MRWLLPSGHTREPRTTSRPRMETMSKAGLQKLKDPSRPAFGSETPSPVKGLASGRPIFPGVQIDAVRDVAARVLAESTDTRITLRLMLVKTDPGVITLEVMENLAIERERAFWLEYGE